MMAAYIKNNFVVYDKLLVGAGGNAVVHGRASGVERALDRIAECAESRNACNCDKGSNQAIFNSGRSFVVTNHFLEEFHVGLLGL